MRPRFAFSLGLLVPWLASTAEALTVTPEAVAQQLAAATLVADIDVRAKETVADPRYGMRFQATARITGVHRGNDGARAGDDILIGGPGGETGELGIYLPGFPRPHVGRRYRVHLRPGTGGAYEILGYENGLVPIDGARIYSRNRTDGSNGDGVGAYLYWDRSFFPLNYFISAPTFASNPDFIPAIDAAFKTWRDVEDTRQEFLAMGCSSVSRNGNDGINAVLLVSSDWPFDTSAIAITRNFYVAGHNSKSGMILDSDILLNAVDHVFSTNDEPGTHDVQNIVTHEVGHFLGLGHEISPHDNEATMSSVASTGETKKRTLQPNDIAGIREAYGGGAAKFPSATATLGCNLGGTACIATHLPGPESTWGLGAALLYLLTLIGVGRRLAKL